MRDPVTLAALGLAAGAPLALAPLPTALAVLAVLWLWSRSRAVAVHRGRLLPAAAVTPGARWALALALCAAVVGSVRARHALQSAHQRWAVAAQHLQGSRRCWAEGVVVSSPVVLRQSAVVARGAVGAARVHVRLLAGDCEGTPIAVRWVARLYGAPDDLGRGDRVELAADLAPVQLFWNPGLPDPRRRLALDGAELSGSWVHHRVLERGSGIPRRVDQARAAVRRRIDATYAPDAAPFARALVLGEADLLAADRDAFRRSGLAHLLAVSGMHLVLVVLALVRALRFVMVRIPMVAAGHDVGRWAAALGAVLCWLYADFAGGGGSALRAAAMLSVALLARALGRQPCSTRAFACSVAGGAAIEPLAVCDLSFALSVAATAGILSSRGWAAALGRRGPRPLRWLGGAIACTAGAMAGCAPVVALLAAELPVLGLAANVVAAPIGELAALPLCLVHGVLWWAPAAERGAAVVAAGALAVVRAVAHGAASSSVATLPVPPPTDAQLAWLAVSLAALYATRSAARRAALGSVALATLLLLEWAAVRTGAPRGRLRVTFLDVGQGDAALVDFPDGRLMMVDGGGSPGNVSTDTGRRVLLPVLRQRRRNHVDVVVATHPHADHVGGLLSALPELTVGEIWDTGQAEAEHPHCPWSRLLVQARRRGTVVRGPSELCGKPRRFGAATAGVLGPCPALDFDAGANDNSMVIRVSFGARAALLVGDAERSQERALLMAESASLRADVIKLGHHGSRTSSSPRFVRQVAPAVAVVSCGVRNRFGHPHPETLSTLQRLGVPWWRIDRGGAVVWQTDGQLHGLAPSGSPNAGGS